MADTLIPKPAWLTLEFLRCYGAGMRWPDWEIGRALGIPIRVHASWFLVFLFMTWTLATGYLPEALPGLSSERYWGMGAVAAILLFLSVLLHELGHSQRIRGQVLQSHIRPARVPCHGPPATD